MHTDRISDQLSFEGFDGRCEVAAFDSGALTSDAGALLLRHTDRAIGLFGRVAPSGPCSVASGQSAGSDWIM